MPDKNENGAPGEGAARQDNQQSVQIAPVVNNQKSAWIQENRPPRTIRTLAELGALLDGRAS